MTPFRRKRTCSRVLTLDVRFGITYLSRIEEGTSAFISVPFSRDFPHIASYAPHELAEARTRLTSVAPHANVEANAQLGALFDRAEAEGVGVVLFTY